MSDFFVAEITGSTYVCSVCSVGSSSTVAVFLIGVPLFWSFTVTLNSTVFVSPAANVTSIPLASVSSVSAVTEPPTFTLPSTNVVPSGIVSFTVTVSGAVPLLLSNVIIYVICCPATTFPSAGSAVLCASTFGLFTVSVVSSVGSPSTYAVFLIVSVYVFSANSSTVTSKLTVAVPYSGTVTVIPLFKSVSVYSFSSFAFTTSILPSTNSVPSGISSVIIASPLKPPSFLTVIVYFIISPSNA